jgi:energy-coupling factor transporter ATP-binding protein EcfA2
MPHPILLMGGQQGSGKTTAARFLCGLFDPSDAPTRSQPRDPEAWAISVANGWTAVIDNVSSIPDWWSDALCKAVTGDGWVRRTLYSDGDVSVLSFRRVVVLTSIDAGTLRGDLGERLVLVDLLPITSERRTTERALDATYTTMRPALLGALLDVVSAVLARLDTVDVPMLPRMADFARVLAAMDAAIGTEAMRLYGEQGNRIAGEVLEADPVGEAVVRFIANRRDWSGRMNELLGLIRPDDAGREWPKHGRGLGACLKRLAPALAVQGVRVTAASATDKRRVWVLQTTAPTAQPPTNDPGVTPSGAGVGGSVLRDAQPLKDRPHAEPTTGPTRADSGLMGGLGDSSHGATGPHATGETWADGWPIIEPGADAGDCWGEVGP